MPVTPLYGSVSTGDAGYVTGIALINSDSDDLTKHDTGTVTPVVPLGATYGDGSYYRIYRTSGRYASNKFEAVNPVTWATTLAPSSFTGFAGTTALGMTYDLKTGTIYYATPSSPWQVNTVATAAVPPTAIASKFCNIPEQWVALAMDSENNALYGFTLSGTLKKLDTQTKEVSVVGETGLVSAAGTSAAIDPATGNLYFASWPSDQASGLYFIDKNTAEATLVKSFTKHEHIQGMFFMPAIVTAAPAKPNMPSATFEGIGMSGKVSFYMPGTSMGGNALEGDVNWTVTADGASIAQGTATPGSQVNVDVTMENPGYVNFSIYCTNDAGESPKAHCSALVGPDQPLAVTNIAFSLDGYSSTLTWTAPTTGVNGKTLDADHVTFDVYRLPSREKVGEGLTECSFTETIAEPEQLTVYNYEIVARHYTVEGQSATGPSFVLGAAKPPYSEDFKDFKYVPLWTVLDLNGDEHTWSTLFNGYAYLTYISKTWDTEEHNDMLVSPAIDVKGGYVYDIEFELTAAKASEEKPHEISVLWGTAPTAEAMTNYIVEKAHITEQEEENVYTYVHQIFRVRFTPEEDSRVNIGLLSTSNRDCGGNLSIYGFRVMAPKLLESPATVSNLKVLPDFDLKDECTISFTTPTTSIQDKQLVGLTKVEILRNGELFETLTEPETGKEYTVTDTNAAHGENTYQVIAYNDGGASDPVAAVAYTGMQLPAGVPSVSIYETATDGMIHVEWTAPETDVYGQPLNLEYVDYEVMGIDANMESYLLQTNVKSLTADVKVQEPGNMQKYKYVLVYAKNAAGSAPTPGVSNYVIVGEPLPMPFIEHFTTARLDNTWTSNPLIGSHKWTTFPPKSDNLVDVNGDLVVESYSGSVGDRGELQTGKIAITEDNARLSFYAMNNGEESKNAIEAWVILDDGTSEMLCREIPAGSKSEWTFYSASLDAYKGKNIKLNFIGEIIEGKSILLDEVKVDAHYANDLRVEAFNIVRSVKPGMDIPAEVTVMNHGDEAVSDYNVVLLIDDKEVASVAGETLNPGESATVSFNTALHATDAQVKHKGTARIDFEDDQLLDNNSKDCVIVNKVTANPAPTNLTAIESGSSVVLCWNKPVVPSDVPDEVTETFEEYDSWETEYIGYWTLYDEDQLPTTAMDFDGYPLEGEPKSWFIFNGSEKFLPSNWRTHSGDKCISNITSWDFINGDHNSDWIISPALWGYEQDISFYARQCGPYYNETFQVLYSTESDDIADFELLEEVTTSSYNWTKYSYTLPEGTNYFAIRCISLNQYMLQIDDITYTPDNGSSPNLELKSYDIWRDGEKVGNTSATVESYLDPINDGNDHTYMLTANYNRGVSAPSNEATIHTSSLKGVTDQLHATVSAENDVIRIAGDCNNVTVYSADGRLVTASTCNGHLDINVIPGVYVVCIAGQQPVKVVVK